MPSAGKQISAIEGVSYTRTHFKPNDGGGEESEAGDGAGRRLCVIGGKKGRKNDTGRVQWCKAVVVVELGGLDEGAVQDSGWQRSVFLF